MLERGEGTIINVAGMIAFSGPAGPSSCPAAPCTPEHSPTQSRGPSSCTPSSPRKSIRVQVVCPGVVATEFHARQGMELSAVPRISAQDVVTAGLRAIQVGEVVCAPGVERDDLLQTVFDADLAAFGAQSPELARRYLTPTKTPAS